MEMPHPSFRIGRPAPAARLLRPLLALALVAAVLTWSVKAVSDETPYDVGLAYLAGERAWTTGHPEDVETWISTPFLGMVMAISSRVVDLGTAVKGLTFLNLALALGLTAAVWARLRNELPFVWWWSTLAGAVLFAPLISSVWWKQFNVVAFVLAVAAFALVRSGRDVLGGATIALSLSVKPLLLLLPLALLLRRDTRRSGLWSIVWIAVLLVIAQVFLAVRAGSVSALSPIPTAKAFSERTKPENIWPCHTENFAPGSLLCRLAGGEYWSYERVVILLTVTLFAALAYDSIRHRPGTSWSAFAFASLLSPMISPIAWSHYQLLLAPMLLLLAREFVVFGARVPLWGSLAASFVLTELIWRPYGTLPGTVNEFLTGRTETLGASFAVMSISQFAQYLLFLTALVWFTGHKLDARTTREVVKPDSPSK
jgi:Glycosyltransferase family 87